MSSFSSISPIGTVAAELSAPRAFAQCIDSDVPLRVRCRVRALVAGEDADQVAAQSCRHIRQVLHMPDLHFAVRNIAVLRVSGEVRIADDTCQAQPVLVQPGAKPRPDLRIPVQHGKCGRLAISITPS